MTDKRASLSGLIAIGFLILLPVLLLGLILAKLYELLAGWVHLLLDAMPGVIFHSEFIRFLAVVLAIVVLFVTVGVLAETRVGRATGRWLELSLLSRLPFYNTLRVLVAGLAGRKETEAMRPVVVKIDDAGLDQLGFSVETHADGRLTVFLPDTPNPSSGTTVIVPRNRLRDLNVPVGSVLGCLVRWGHGTAKLLERAENRLNDPNRCDNDQFE